MIVWLPTDAPAQSYVYGALASSPSLVAPSKNSTLATLPSSEALAAIEIVAGVVNDAPLAGAVRLTLGALLPVDRDHLRHRRHARRSTTNSMYTPGGAMFAFAGAVAVNDPAPAV